MALALAGAIVASDDVQGDRVTLHASAAPTIARLRLLAAETIPAATGLSDANFVHLLEASRALDGDQRWGRRLNHLNDGEFPAACPACGNELFAAVGQYGFFVTSEE